MPVFGVSPLFATILPVGFAGGHGTAGGLTPTYKTVSHVYGIFEIFEMTLTWLSSSFKIGAHC